MAKTEEKIAEVANVDESSDVKNTETQEEVKASDVTEAKKEDQTILTPLEDYIKTASYLGTKVITPTMRKYVYRRRLDGLAILNTLLVDKKLAEGINFVKQFKPNDWTLVCKREAGWRGPRQKEIASEVQHERKNIKTACFGFLFIQKTGLNSSLILSSFSSIVFFTERIFISV